jgi:predicted ATPase
MFLHSILVRPHLSAFVSLKMIKLTLKHGLCFLSPLAFAVFGVRCIQYFPDTDNAFRFGNLGLELLDNFQVREYLPRVYVAYYAGIVQWKYPLQACLDHLIQAQRVGMQTGDKPSVLGCKLEMSNLHL